MEPVSENGKYQLDKGASSAGGEELYGVSITKFLLLYVMTLGGYMMYWSYRNWKFYSCMSQTGIMPVMRGIFWPFFIFSLLARIKAASRVKGDQCHWSSEIRGLLIFSLVLVSWALGFILNEPADSMVALVAGVIVIAVGAYLFVDVQRVVNQLTNDPQGRGNSEMTAANMIWVILGGLYWVFVTLGTFAVQV
ncbi:hypothetical protein ACIQYF_09330 [Pseudomonas sp. NPDC096917]|uniref:hypothetical protein n=1 Tax=Pseudomonas sp. NPDC096917 TaxID=3364483 RepID=UPI00383B3C06